jgi:hypothetical protein
MRNILFEYGLNLRKYYPHPGFKTGFKNESKISPTGLIFAV